VDGVDQATDKRTLGCHAVVTEQKHLAGQFRVGQPLQQEYNYARTKLRFRLTEDGAFCGEDLPSLTAGIDVALRYGKSAAMQGDSRKLFNEVACPVGKLEVIGRIAGNPERLSTAPLIHVRSNATHHWAGWQDYLAARDLPRPKGSVHLFDNYIHAVQAAMDGRGIMLGWRSITRKFIEDGTLAELPQGEHNFGTAYFVTTAPTSRHKTAVTDFVGWLQEVAPDEGSVDT